MRLMAWFRLALVSILPVAAATPEAGCIGDLTYDAGAWLSSDWEPAIAFVYAPGETTRAMCCG